MKEALLADESVDFRRVTHLRGEGHEIASVIEMAPGMTDEELLRMANEQGRILLADDKDFGELTYRLRRPNRGIVLIRMSGLSIEIKLDKISRAIMAYSTMLPGNFVVISKGRVRIKAQI